jgi:hypothetical protein
MAKSMKKARAPNIRVLVTGNPVMVDGEVFKFRLLSLRMINEITTHSVFLRSQGKGK